jgi:hypothetical protein
MALENTDDFEEDIASMLKVIRRLVFLHRSECVPHVEPGAEALAPAQCLRLAPPSLLPWPCNG